MLQSKYKIKLILNFLSYKIVCNIFVIIYIFNIVDKYCAIISFNIIKIVKRFKFAIIFKLVILFKLIILYIYIFINKENIFIVIVV